MVESRTALLIVAVVIAIVTVVVAARVVLLLRCLRQWLRASARRRRTAASGRRLWLIWWRRLRQEIGRVRQKDRKQRLGDSQFLRDLLRSLGIGERVQTRRSRRHGEHRVRGRDRAN